MTKFTKDQELLSLFFVVIAIAFIMVGVFIGGLVMVGFIFIGIAFILPFVRIMSEQEKG